MQSRTDYKAVAYFVNWCVCTGFYVVPMVPNSGSSGQSMEGIISHRNYPRTSSRTYSMPLQMSDQKVEKCRLSPGGVAGANDLMLICGSYLTDTWSDTV